MTSGTKRKVEQTATKAPRARIHLDFLDEIRGLAILMVFAYHSLSYAYGINKLGWTGWHRSLDYTWDFLLLIPLTLGPAGVAIFFVISGFCIHLSHARTALSYSNSKLGWLNFMLRRFFRIYPPYIAAVILFLVGDIANGQLVNASEIIRQLWTHALLIHNLWGDTLYGINPSFWSIGVEAQLYAIYPILYWISTKVGWKKSMILAFICELLIRSTHFTQIDTAQWLHGGPFAYWFSWATGAYLAEAWSKKEERELPFSRIPISLLHAGVAATWFFKPLDPYFFPLVSLTCATYISKKLVSHSQPVLHETQPKKSRTLITFGFMGSISYSLYLFHQPLISIHNKVLLRLVPDGLPSLAYLLLILCSLAPITLFSWLSFRWLENYGITLGKYWVHRLCGPRKTAPIIQSQP